MSDVVRIAAERRRPREVAQLDFRAVFAAEQAADALEGIRQDLAAAIPLLTQIAQALSAIAQKP